jgi:hypothetical protein
MKKILDAYVRSRKEIRSQIGVKIAGIMLFILGILGNFLPNESLTEHLAWSLLFIIGILVYTKKLYFDWTDNLK